jgi:hypothetical protein
MPQIADALARNKESAKAEQLYRRLFAVVESWSVDSLQPLATVTQSYARFLTWQPGRQEGGQVFRSPRHQGGGSVQQALAAQERPVLTGF